MYLYFFVSFCFVLFFVVVVAVVAIDILYFCFDRLFCVYVSVCMKDWLVRMYYIFVANNDFLIYVFRIDSFRFVFGFYILENVAIQFECFAHKKNGSYNYSPFITFVIEKKLFFFNCKSGVTLSSFMIVAVDAAAADATDVLSIYVMGVCVCVFVCCVVVVAVVFYQILLMSLFSFFLLLVFLYGLFLLFFSLNMHANRLNMRLHHIFGNIYEMTLTNVAYTKEKSAGGPAR